MSLKSILTQIIKERGSVTLIELEGLCHKLGYKLSNAERRLRESRGEIQPIYNEKQTAIIGYRYLPEGHQTPNPAPVAMQTPEVAKDACCYSATFYKDKFGFPIHTKDCVIMEQMERHAKILEENNKHQLRMI